MQSSLSGKTGRSLVMLVILSVSLFLWTGDSSQAITYNAITVDGTFSTGEWDNDEIFINIAGSFTDFRITWDSTNLYFGFNGGDVESDKYVVALDTNPGSYQNGNAGPWAGVTFPAYGRPDYIVEFNGSGNTVYASGLTATNVARGRNISSDTVELSIPRSDLNNLSTSAAVGVYMYASNSSDNVFAFLGSTSYGNPGSGGGVTPATQFYLPTTDSGRAPNTYFRYQSDIFSGKTISPNNNDPFNDIIIDGGTLNGPSSGVINVARDFHFDATNAGTFNLDGSTVNFNGNGTIKGGHLTGVTFNNVTIASGATLGANSNFRVEGNWSNSGSFTASAGTAEFLGSSSSVLSGDSTFCNLNLNKSSGASTDLGTGATTVSGDLNKGSSGDMTPNSSTVVMTGSCGSSPYMINGAPIFNNLTIASGATVSDPAESPITLSIKGNLTTNGTFSQEASQKALFNGGVTQTLAGSGSTAFGRLEVGSSSTVNAGVHSFTVTGSDFNVSSTSTFNGGSATVTFGGGTTALAGAGPYNFNALTIDSGATLVGKSAGDKIIGVAGNWTNNGAYTHNSGGVTFNGLAAQTIGGTASTTFNNLTLNNTAGANLGVDQRVIGTLTFTNGRLTLGSHDLTLGPSANPVAGTLGDSKMIVADGSGSLCKEYEAAGNFTFPVGDATDTAEYSPATVDFTSGTFSSGDNACVRVTDAKHPNNSSANDYITRYWTVNQSGIDNFSANVAFTYVDADIVGSEASLYGGKWDGALPWTLLNQANSGTNTFNGTVDSFSDFTAGDQTSLPVTLSYFASRRTVAGVQFDWQTSSELGNVGFNLYVQTNDGRRQLNDQLIASGVQDSLTPQDYSFDAIGEPGATYYLEEVDLLGRTRLHGPFNPGQAYGAPAVLEPIDWDSIHAEVASIQGQREIGWLSRAQAQVDAFRQKALASQVKEATFSTNRTFLPMVVGSHTGVSANDPLLELRVRKDGIYRVTYEQLAAASLDLAGVPANQIALINRGQPVARRIVSPASFGPGSYIEFYGEAVDTLYTDTSVYYLLLDAAQVLVMPVDTTPVPGTASAVSYVHTERWENQRTYGFSSPNGDPWYDTRLLAYTTPTTRTFPLEAEGFMEGVGPAVLTVDLWGGTDWPGVGSDHHVVALVDGHVVADVQFNGLVTSTIEIELPDGLLHAGANTLALVLPGDTGVAWDVVMLDGYSLTYSRTFLARDDTLHFKTTAERLTVSGLTSPDVAVYRLESSGPVRLSQVEISGGAGDLQAKFAGTGHDALYLVAAGQGIMTPELALTRPVANITSGTAGYLMIVHPDFIAAVELLAQFHQARGLDVRVVDVEDVYASFSDGEFDPYAIQSYIRYAAEHMGTQMVLLVGGDTYDYRHYLGQSMSFIPSLYTATDPLVVKYAPVDPLYVDLDGDMLPDLPIGRLPVRTVQELNTVVAKTLAYAAKDYGHTGVFAADAPDGALSFANDSDALVNQLPAGWSVERAYLGELGLAQARDRLLAQINSGVALTGFFGHSGMTHWSFDNLFTTADARALTNAGRPTVVTQWGCWNTYHVQPDYDTLGHSLLLAGDRGAAAVLGASTLTMASADRALGVLVTPRLALPGTPIGEAIQNAKEALAASHPEMIDVLLGWTLLGDPALVVAE